MQFASHLSKEASQRLAEGSHPRGESGGHRASTEERRRRGYTGQRGAAPSPGTRTRDTPPKVMGSGAGLWWSLLLALALGLGLGEAAVVVTTGHPNTTKKGRSLIGHEVEGANGSGRPGYTIDAFATQVLTGGLTTVFLPMVYIIVFIIGLPSNGMALWVFFFRTKKRHPAIIYMANLAMADLLFVLWFPLKIAYHIQGNNWIYGEGLCKVLVVFFYGNMYCSILFITCLSVQRYWVIVNPMSHARKNSQIAIGVSVAIWLLIVLGTIPFYRYNQTAYIVNLNITTCHDVLPLDVLAVDMFRYFLSLAIGVFFFPAVLTTVAYVLMIKTLNASITDENIGKKRKKAIKLILTVLVMYLVCFTPSNILLVVHYALIRNQYIGSVYASYITALCLATINSCIDPFIYYYVSKDFRENVKNTFRCRSLRTVERMRVSFSSMKYSRKSQIYTSSSTKTSSC